MGPRSLAASIPFSLQRSEATVLHSQCFSCWHTKQTMQKQKSWSVAAWTAMPGFSSLALVPVRWIQSFAGLGQNSLFSSSTRNVKSLPLWLAVKNLFGCFRKLIIGCETFTSEGGLVVIIWSCWHLKMDALVLVRKVWCDSVQFHSPSPPPLLTRFTTLLEVPVDRSESQVYWTDWIYFLVMDVVESQACVFPVNTVTVLWINRRTQFTEGSKTVHHKMLLFCYD